MSKRVLLAGLFHETHTFLDGLTTLHNCETRLGRDLLSFAGDSSPMGGALETARESGWTVLPAIDLRAMPGPTVEDRVIDYFWEKFESFALPEIRRGIDGIFLVLHGAMVSQSLTDVEGEILSRIRRIEAAAEVPVCGVIDLHANFTPLMARHSQGLIAYRENPHTDAREAAQAAARLLDRLMRTHERPLTVWEHPPLIWPPTGTSTGVDPLRLLEQTAREIEQAHAEILALNVLAGFAFADSPETGVSFTAVTLGEPEMTRDELKRLSLLAVRHKEMGNVMGLSIEGAMRRLRHLLPSGEECRGPVLLVEPSDNIGGGAPGDGIVLLKALVEERVENAAIIVNDPDTVGQLSSKRLGDRVMISIGGKGSRLGGGPLMLDVELLSTSNGRFEIEDAHSHLASMAGSHIEMGPCAVVRHQGIRILLTSRKTPPFDLAQLRSQGIEPGSLGVIVVKAAVAHRRAYDPIARTTIMVETPGPCSSDLQSLPYHQVRRPVYPLDQIT